MMSIDAAISTWRRLPGRWRRWVFETVPGSVPAARKLTAGRPTSSGELLPSVMCTQEQLQSPSFRRWAVELQEDPDRLHRKLWEYCYIAEALARAEMLEPGRRGLGFAVGVEPLASLFCSLGATVIATDMDPEEAKAQGWVDTNQHASGLDALNERGICDDAAFRDRCSFRAVDMNAIPTDLAGFDFVWSSCAFEHLGSIELGVEFVCRAMDCLRPGGVAVHTTELNLSSNDETVTEGGTVLFRRRDFEEIGRRLTDAGHEVTLDFTPGTLPADEIVDVPPYDSDVHLRLQLGDYVTTSYGLTIRAAS